MWRGWLVLSLVFSACCAIPQAVRAQGANVTEAATRQYATAVALQNRDEFELAADEWAKFLKNHAQDVRSPRARHYRGLCLLKLKQYAPALEVLGKLLADAPQLPPDALTAEAADGTKSDLLPPTYLYTGLCELNLGQSGQAPLLAKAQQTFAALATKYPQGKFSAQALFYQGEAVYAAGRKAEAIKLYDEAATKYPKDSLAPDALYALGVTQAELNEHAAADATFARFLATSTDHRLAAEVQMRRGEALLQQNKLDEAEKLLAAAAAAPGFSLADHALMRQAVSLFLRKQYAPANAIYAAVLQKFPQSPYRNAATLGVGKCAYMLRDYPAARNSLAKVVTAEGDLGAEAAHWLARCYLKEKQPAEALKSIEPQLAKAAAGPWGAQLQLDQADALFDQPARQKEAVALYAKIAETQPKHELAPQALYMSSFAALGLNDYDTATRRAAEFLQKYPQNDLAPDVGYVAAEAELLRGKYAPAAQAYAALLTKHAQHHDAPTWQVRRALALYLDKQYAEAVKLLTPVAPTIADPELKAEAYYLLGSSYSDLKNYDQAAVALEASLKASPKWRQADETLVALAVVLRQQNKLALARQALEQVSRDVPNSKILDKVHYRLGEYAYAAGDYPKALAEYQKMLSIAPQSTLVPHARYGLAWAEYRSGNAAVALKTLDALIAAQPGAPKSSDDQPLARSYARAVVRHAEKQYPAAITDLEAFLKTNPTATERSDARYLLGLCQAGAQQTAAAIATFQQLLKEDPQYAGLDKVLNELAWSYKGDNKAQEASDTFARLTRERPDSALAMEALYHLGEYRYQKEDYKQASKDFYAVTQKAPPGSLGENAIHMLGWAYFKSGEFDSARASFAAQRVSYPMGELFSDAAYMEAEALFKEGKFQESLARYEQVTQPKAKGLTVLARLHAGQAAAQLKQWDKALVYLGQAEKVDAQSEYLGEVLYEQGWAKQNLGKLDEAIKLYEAVTEQTSTEAAARARFMIGEVYFERKEHAQAVKEFFKVAYTYSYPQWQAAAQYEAGRCFEVLGKKEQARKSYQEVVDKFPQSDRAALAKQRLVALGG